MPSRKYVPTTRVSPEKITLRNGQFSKWLSKKHGVSQEAMSKAMQLITDGVIEALADGFDINFDRLGTFQTREMPPRMRYHRLRKERYIAAPSTIIHFSKSLTLTKRVRALAKARLEAVISNSHVK